MEYGCGLSSSPLTVRFWISSSSNDLEMGIRDWHTIQSCSVRSDRPVHERIVCNRFLRSVFIQLVTSILKDYIFDMNDK